MIASGTAEEPPGGEIRTCKVNGGDVRLAYATGFYVVYWAKRRHDVAYTNSQPGCAKPGKIAGSSKKDVVFSYGRRQRRILGI